MSRAILIIISIFTICIIAVIIIFASVYQREKAQFIPIIQQFLTAVTNRDIDKAYKLTSTQYQNKYPPEKFKIVIKNLNLAFKPFKKTRLIEFSLHTKNNNRECKAKLETDFENAQKLKTIFRFVKQDDQWKILGFTFDSLLLARVLRCRSCGTQHDDYDQELCDACGKPLHPEKTEKEN